MKDTSLTKVLQLTPDTIVILLSLILPEGCQCSLIGKSTYCITCLDIYIAKEIWERRFETIYPLLNQGDCLEVVGKGFSIKSYPLPFLS